jgi:6-phosphogluconolactonase (cycloisomerase 2 family)
MRRVGLLLVSVLSVFAAVSARAQTPLDSAFTYQGELTSSGTPATGTYDIRFRLYDAADRRNQIGPILCSDNLSVSAGRFAVTLDFGPAAFDGQQRFLEIEVRADAGQDCGDESSFTILTPRQEVTAAPNALFAQNAATATTATTALTADNAASLDGLQASFFNNAANLTGTLADARLSTNIARLNSNQTFTGQLTLANPANTFAGNGAGLTNLSGASINAGTLTRASLSADVQSGVGTLVPDLSLAGSVATGTNPTSVAVSGSFAYVVNKNSNTLQIFSVSNPAAPTLVGSVATGFRPNFVAVSGAFAYVVNESSNTLQIFNISNPAVPTFAGGVGTGSSPASVAVSGSFAYVVNQESDTLQIFNISNPAVPTFAGGVITFLGPSSVAVSGSFAYVPSLSDDRLQVFNISNPGAPALTGLVATGGGSTSVVVSGSFLYVVNQNSSTLQVFNISNPAAPTLAGSVATGSLPISVAVSGSFAYVVNQSSNTLQVFNISNLGEPTLARGLATGSFPSSVAVSGSFACLVNGSSNTLQVVNAPLGVGFAAPLASSSLAGVNGSGLNGVNAAQLNGQAASFYTNASSISSGTLADARLSSNIALKNSANAFTSTGVTSFAGRLGIGTITPSSQFSLEAVSAGATQIALTGGPATGGAIPPRTWSIQSTDVNGPLNQITGSFQIVDRTAIAARLLIDTNGNVGIGTTAPSQRLTVAGNMSVTGSLSKGGGSFKIDHPLDPENKYLYHSFVESPDMMNIYNGNIVTDADGYATITLPDYFEALNRDFRYQLTVIDESNDMDVFLWAKVVRKIGGNQFTIRSSRGSLEVSWQVTGIRKDAWAEKNRIPNSVDKTPAEKGKFLHPEAFDKPASRSIYSSPAVESQPGSK